MSGSRLRARIAGLAFVILLRVFAAWATGETATSPKNADRIAIAKSERKLTLMSGDKVLKTYED